MTDVKVSLNANATDGRPSWSLTLPGTTGTLTAVLRRLGVLQITPKALPAGGREPIVIGHVPYYLDLEVQRDGNEVTLTRSHLVYRYGDQSDEVPVGVRRDILNRILSAAWQLIGMWGDVIGTVDKPLTKDTDARVAKVLRGAASREVRESRLVGRLLDFLEAERAFSESTTAVDHDTVVTYVTAHQVKLARWTMFDVADLLRAAIRQYGPSTVDDIVRLAENRRPYLQPLTRGLAQAHLATAEELGICKLNASGQYMFGPRFDGIL